MEEFAQSRTDDDLFDDDIVPVQPSAEDVEVEAVAKQLQDTSLETAPKGPSADTFQHRGDSQRGNRARGRGGRGRGVERPNTRPNTRQQSSTLLQSKYAPAPTQTDCDAPNGSPAAAIPSDLSNPSGGEAKPTSTTVVDSENPSSTTPAPLTESLTPARPPAVRGDRTATGGIKKPKLTDEELSAKLAAAKTRSENISAAHARAEADAANFAERERAAAEKRIKDVASRKAMEGEREKNRARKMAVMGGREWDAEKNEEDFKMASRGRARGNYTRGANGGVRVSREELPDDDLRQYQWKDDRGGSRGRGRRGRRGSERGAARGRTERRTDGTGQPDINAENDFPSLPATIKSKDDASKARRPDQNSSGLEVVPPTAEAGSWADQVEVSEAAKPQGR